MLRLMKGLVLSLALGLMLSLWLISGLMLGKMFVIVVANAVGGEIEFFYEVHEITNN